MAAVAPEVSVVIPTRDRSDFLRQAVAGALAQRDVDVEVIVVDDASQGDTVAGLGALAADERVTVVPLPMRRGVSRARNVGIERARAPRVAFLDDDDLWAPGYLRAHLDAAAEHDADLTYASRLVVDEHRRPLRCMLAELPEEVPQLLLYGNVVGTPSCVVVRTETLRATDGFDETLSALADWGLWLTLCSRAVLAPVAEPLVGYTVHPGNMHRRDPFGVVEEFERLRATPWALERRPFLHWLAAELIQHGDRRRAAGTLVHLARREGGTWRDYGLAAAVALGLVDDVVGESSRPVAAPAWLREAVSAVPAA